MPKCTVARRGHCAQKY